MWQWLTELLAKKPAKSAPQHRRTPRPAPQAGAAKFPTEQPPGGSAADNHFPDAAKITLTFYQQLLNAKPDQCTEPDQLSAPEALWLKARTLDLNQTPTQLTQLVPRLPSVLPKLMTALNNIDTPIRSLTELIESDPIISTHVLRLINSPAMRVRREQITSLEQAVMLLGFSGMREVVSAAMFSPIAQLSHIEGIHPLLIHDIWPASLRAANALRQGLKHQSASRTKIDANLGFELYLSMLIEHTGLIALIRQKPLTGNNLSAAYVAEFRALVPAYSARIAEAWALSPRTIALIRNPPPELSSRREEARYFALACALNRRGYLDQAQFLHLCRALPDYAQTWYEQCRPQNGESTED
ncbi:MAG: hypothetical protein B7Y53_00110 [Halothiobacillus sp. 28-55-5]|nr:MAG: hypothetical protein B7Y53_00110 [Halothiobacillus sp. 28-55-5]